MATAPLVQADEAKDRFNFATGLFIKNEHQLAAEEFEKLLKDFPDCAEADVALYRLAESLWKLKKTDQAAMRLRELTIRFPQSERCPQAYYRLGEILSEQDPAAAAAAYGTVFAKWPEHKLAEAALYWSAEEYFRAGKLADAAAAYSSVLERFGTGKYVPFCLYSLGWTEYKQEKYSDAVARFQQFLTKFPTHELANSGRLKLAESLHKLKQYAKACELFRQVAVADQTLAAEATIGFAWSLYESGDRSAAADAFLRAADLLGGKDQAARCLFNAGNSLVEAGIFDKAEVVFGRLAREFPQHELAAESAYWQGYCLARLKRWDDALGVLGKLQAAGMIKKREPEILYTTADALFGKGDFTAAAAKYGEVVTRFSDHELADEAAYAQMLALERSGNLDGATTVGTDFLRRFPASPIIHLVRFALAEYNFRQSRWEQAETGFREFLAGKEHGDLAEVAEHKLGWCAFSLGKPADALEHFLTVVTRYPESPLAAESFYAAGRAAQESGNAGRARELYGQCVAKYPKTEHGRRAELALILLDLDAGKSEEARKAALRFLEADSKGPLADFARVYLGGALLELDRYDEALAAYQEVKTDPVAVAEASYGSAWAYRRKGDHRKAAEVFAATAALKGPKAEEAAFWRCRSLEDAGNLDAAVSAYGEFIAAYPGSVHADEAEYRRAVCESRRGRTDQAWTLYENFLKAKPASDLADNVLYDMAWMRKAAGDAGGAARFFEQMLARYPGSELAADVEFRIGELAQDGKEYRRACEYYRKVLARPNVAFADKVLYKLAWCHRELGEASEACNLFRRIFQEHPQSELADEARYRVGMYLQEQKKYEEALARFAEVRGTEFKERSSFQRAECLRLAERFVEALKAYDALLAEFPNGAFVPQAHLGRGHCYRALGANDDAIDAYRSVTRATEAIEAARAELGIGYCLFAKRQYAEAVKSFLKVDILYGYDELKPEALSMVVKCWRELKDTAKADKYLGELRTRYPDSPYAKQ
ncbi:MAG: tetratricopeptide repeat protein [Kiritimatiellia bacterium]